MRIIRVLSVFLVLLAVPVGQSAATPLTLHHQGLITDNTGAPLSGSFSLTFKLYSVPTGGVALWSETQTVTATAGLFQATLGNITPLSASLFSGAQPATHLGVTVGADPELSPRAELSSTPYALKAAEVEGFSSGPNNVNLGQFSIVGGDNNTNNSDFSSILGGEDNEVTVTEFADTTFDSTGLFQFDGARVLHPPGSGTILGGHFNLICGNHSVIVQGFLNVNCAPYSFLGTGYRNRIFGSYSTLGSGYRNEISAPADYSVLAGGALNRGNSWTSVISGGVYNTTTGGPPTNYRGQVIGGGWLNTTDNHFSTISGGERNAAIGAHATVGGGQMDTAIGSHATVAGGRSNTAPSPESFIGGGSRNRAEGQASTIGGGEGNLTSLHPHQFIGGGQNNLAFGPLSTIGGGQSNETSTWATVGGGVLNKSINEYTFIGGGFDNVANAHAAVIGGGLGNLSSNRATTVGGGELNGVFGSHSFIGGGFVNSIQGDTAAIAGGSGNVVTGVGGFIGAGLKNSVLSLVGVVGGGNGNNVSGNGGVIGGGARNVIGGGGVFATIPGGSDNVASAPNSFAAGTTARALDTCAFVWSDCCRVPGTTTNQPFESSLANSFNARALNGFYFLTSCDSVFDPASGIGGTGVYVPPGGAMWLTGSSRTLKKNITPVDGSDILARVEQMPVYRWSYKTQGDDIEHIGPMAEDFYETFKLGDNDRSIGAMDPAGVSLAATKALIKENKELKERLERLEKLVSNLIEQD